jgi:bifunctional non-homologous end joining protein LigD
MTGAMAERNVTGRTIELSNLDKVYFPGDPPILKGDVVDYYERIAEHMLPHVVDRPLVLQRFPDGIEGFGFYQKNTPDHVPDWIERIDVDTVEGGITRYPVVHDPAGLVYLANQGAIVFHTLLARAEAPTTPVEVIFDLDPSSDDLGPVRAAATELRSVLDDLGLAPRVKSSGSRGLHIVVDVVDVVDGTGDVGGRNGFDLTSTFARRVAEVVSERGDFTLEHRKKRRRGRLFLDILRNGPASHAVAPYSLRPIDGAPIAAPLDWDEALAADFHPRRITIGNVFRRLAQKRDPWTDPPVPMSTIADALARIEQPG